MEQIKEEVYLINDERYLNLREKDVYKRQVLWLERPVQQPDYG